MAESEKRIRVLYVCPWAHWAGHAPQVVEKESRALLKAGVEVSLCTFQGIRDEQGLEAVPHRMVVSGWLGFPFRIFKYVERFTRLGRSIAWAVEQFSTLCLAVKLTEAFKYDVIYLRDGDPFVFMPFILGLFVRHQRWAIHLIGTPPVRSPGTWFYKFINAPFWKPVYRRSLSRNRYIFTCENSYMKRFCETHHLDGILSGRVRLLPVGVEKPAHRILREEARARLGLPEDRAIFLSFGSLHPGKAMEPVLAAFRELPDAMLVHAGDVVPGYNLKQAVKHYGLENRVITIDHYIPEEEKPYYFASADAIVLSYKKDFIQTASMLWEAAKFRLPAIASDVGELGGLVRRYRIGLVFKAEDAASLKTVLSEFLSSSQRDRETMVSNCDRFSDDFSLDAWVRACLDTFIELTRDDNRDIKKAGS